MGITDIFKQAIPLEKAEQFPTKRLLTYYKKYRYIVLRCIPSSKRQELDWYVGEVLPDEEYSCIKLYFDSLKSILDSREHI